MSKIRTIEVSSFVSKVATITEVRAKISGTAKEKWEMIIVMDGRGI
jgi:cytidylate kinase